MKLWRLLSLLFAILVPLAAQNPGAEALRRGILQEDSKRNPEAAIREYQAALAAPGVDRAIAATAWFRIAECYRKQKKEQQATEAYQRVSKEFADQGALAEQARERLATYYPSAAAREYRAVLQEKLQIARQFVDYLQKQLNLGAMSPLDTYEPHMRLLEAERDLAALDAGMFGEQLSTLPAAGRRQSRSEYRKILAIQIDLAKKNVNAKERQYQLGVLTAEEVQRANLAVLDLRREAIAFDAGVPLGQERIAKSLASPAPQPPSGANQENPQGSYWQVAALAPPDADAVVRTLREKGFVSKLSPVQNNLVRVLVGPYHNDAAMAKAKAALEAAGFGGLIRR
jgi:hypothetical protein